MFFLVFQLYAAFDLFLTLLAPTELCTIFLCAILSFPRDIVTEHAVLRHNFYRETQSRLAREREYNVSIAKMENELAESSELKSCLLAVVT
jgi:hypothetical protein